MIYRTLGRTGIRVSEIGMGCEGFVDKPYEQVLAFVDRMEALGATASTSTSPTRRYAPTWAVPCGGGGRSSSSRPTSALSGGTGSTSGPGISTRSGRASGTSWSGWRRTMWKSA